MFGGGKANLRLPSHSPFRASSPEGFLSGLRGPHWSPCACWTHSCLWISLPMQFPTIWTISGRQGFLGCTPGIPTPGQGICSEIQYSTEVILTDCHSVLMACKQDFLTKKSVSCNGCHPLSTDRTLLLYFLSGRKLLPRDFLSELLTCFPDNLLV